MRGGLAEIRGWLVKGESEAGWLGMCRVLEGAEASEREMLVGYVAQHTKGWGESIRRPLYEWWEKHRRGEATGFEGLVGDGSRYAWEEGKVAGEVRHVASVEGMRMRWIPAGTFWMGAGEDEDQMVGVPFIHADEMPRHEVTLTRGFWMLETPVTQRQYLAVMGYNASYFRAAGLDAPVESVSWHDAAAFANKLSFLEGVLASFVGEDEAMEGVGDKESDYVGSKGWRLPTEAEWEYAARAGTTALRYGEVAEIAWSWRDGETTHAVGQKQANAWGVYDMLGNVWEWCYDGYDAYSEQAATDPVANATGVSRVKRGGSWAIGEFNIRAAKRELYAPFEREIDVGFRLVRGR